MNVEGKVIVITGAARGIGQEYARYLGSLGARIVIADINDCSKTLDLVKAERGTVVAAKLDVASASSAMDMARTARDAFGRIDALINNAALYGGLKGGRFDAISETDWDAAMAVNVKGVWNCCKAVVPAIRQAGGGSIVNIASLAATYSEGDRRADRGGDQQGDEASRSPAPLRRDRRRRRRIEPARTRPILAPAARLPGQDREGGKRRAGEIVRDQAAVHAQKVRNVENASRIVRAGTRSASK